MTLCLANHPQGSWFPSSRTLESRKMNKAKQLPRAHVPILKALAPPRSSFPPPRLPFIIEDFIAPREGAPFEVLFHSLKCLICARRPASLPRRMMTRLYSFWSTFEPTEPTFPSKHGNLPPWRFGIWVVGAHLWCPWDSGLGRLNAGYIAQFL